MGKVGKYIVLFRLDSRRRFSDRVHDVPVGVEELDVEASGLNLSGA